jgi:hypothetical protein
MFGHSWERTKPTHIPPPPASLTRPLLQVSKRSLQFIFSTLFLGLSMLASTACQSGLVRQLHYFESIEGAGGPIQLQTGIENRLIAVLGSCSSEFVLINPAGTSVPIGGPDMPGKKVEGIPGFLLEEVECSLQQPVLCIFSFEGHLIRTDDELLDGSLVWDGCGETGRAQRPGVYLYIAKDDRQVIASCQVTLVR